MPTSITKLAGVSKLKPFKASKLIVLCELNKIWSDLELKSKRPEFIITWSPVYDGGDVGVSLNLGVYEKYLWLATLIGICWVEVKYIDDLSLFIFSVIGIHPSSVMSSSVLISLPSDVISTSVLNIFEGWPFLSIIIGLPFSPLLDQSLKLIDPDFAVLPILILLPHLPWFITSP